MPLTITRIITLLALACASLPAAAAGYHVEVIVFAHLRHADDGEVSPAVGTYPDFSGSVEPAVEYDADNPFLLLTTGFYKLGGVYNQLRASGIYRPLVHMAWQQPALTGDHALPVHVSLSEMAADSAVMKIDGAVRIRAAQFLHADVDLLYFPDNLPALPPTPGEDQLAGFTRMKESRRMKLNELHYFDHPLFGMLLYVSRARAD